MQIIKSCHATDAIPMGEKKKEQKPNLSITKISGKIFTFPSLAANK